MILVDSNIIIYAINESSSKHYAAKEFIESKADNLCVAHQNLLESYRVLTYPNYPNPMSPAKAYTALASLLDLGVGVVCPRENTVVKALRYASQHNVSFNKIFDVYLYFTALDNGVYSIATENTKDFEDFEGLEVINPFSV